MYRHIETYRGFVYPGGGDHKGRVSPSFYAQRFDEASRQFMAFLGLSPAVLAPRDHGAIAVEQRTERKRDVLEGGLLHIATELLDLGARHLSFLHRMYDSETMEEVARAEFLGVCFDNTSAVSIEVPELTREHAMGLLIGSDHPALPLRRPVAA